MKILYLGRNSFKITTNKNIVIYIDPFAPYHYNDLADIVLVTHEHSDHNQIQLVNKDDNTLIINSENSLVNNVYKSFTKENITITSVEAYNKNHDKSKCVGYLIKVDDLLLYFTGDTSKTTQMEQLSNLNIDYTFICCDGYYNMDINEAKECAKLINSKYYIPIHTSKDQLYSLDTALKFDVENKIILQVNETLEI